MKRLVVSLFAVLTLTACGEADEPVQAIPLDDPSPTLSDIPALIEEEEPGPEETTGPDPAITISVTADAEKILGAFGVTKSFDQEKPLKSLGIKMSKSNKAVYVVSSRGNHYTCVEDMLGQAHAFGVSIDGEQTLSTGEGACPDSDKALAAALAQSVAADAEFRAKVREANQARKEAEAEAAALPTEWVMSGSSARLGGVTATVADALTKANRQKTDVSTVKRAMRHLEEAGVALDGFTLAFVRATDDGLDVCLSDGGSASATYTATDKRVTLRPETPCA